MRVYEKQDRQGGVIRTEHEKGFTFETGPNTGVLSHPEVAELFDALAGACQAEPADETSKRRLIWKNGAWHALPSGLAQAVSTPLFTFKDKIRILGEPFRKRGTKPNERLSQLVKRRLGQSFLDYAVDPFILGIYAGDPNYLVPKYALPKLYNLEQNYGSFIGGAFKKKFEKKSPREQKATRKVFSVKGGLENLISALAGKIGQENIVLGCKNLRAKPENGKFTLEYEQNNSQKQVCSAEKVISTIGSHNLETVFGFLPKEELKKLNNLVYAKVVEAALGFKNWQGIALDAFGGLVPSKEQRHVLGILFLSSFLKNRAPKGGALLSVFAGGVRRPELAELPDNEIRQIIAREVKTMMGLTKFAPDVFRTFGYTHAIPQYGENSTQRFDAVQRVEKSYPGLIVAGNLRNGIGMADRIKQARSIAEKITG